MSAMISEKRDFLVRDDEIIRSMQFDFRFDCVKNLFSSIFLSFSLSFDGVMSMHLCNSCEREMTNVFWISMNS